MFVKLCFSRHFIPLDPNECGSDRIHITDFFPLVLMGMGGGGLAGGGVLLILSTFFLLVKTIEKVFF